MSSAVRSTVCFSSIRGVMALPLAVGLLVTLGCPPPPPDTPTLQLAQKKYVRGYIATQVRVDRILDDPKIGNRTIYLPLVKVQLAESTSGTVTGEMHTDLSGRFDFPPQNAGTYKLCWEAQDYIPGCTEVIVDSRPVRLPDILIRAMSDGDQNSSLYGAVRLRDGEPVRFLEPTLSVNRFAMVTAETLDGAGIYRTPVNNFGEYVIPRVPVDKDTHVQVTGQVENERASRLVHGRVLVTGGNHRVDITMRNHAPRLADVIARVGGIQTLRAGPGDSVELSAAASDTDGDATEIRWNLPPGAGSLSATTGSPVTWTVPAALGTYPIYVHAADQRGGYDRNTLRIAVGATDVSFSGRVVDVDGNPIADAKGEIGGKTAKSDANGYLRLVVPEAPRYVLNIRKPGFALVSRIYREGTSSGRWVMSPVTLVIGLDPTQDIVVQDNRQKHRCRPPFSLRVDWENFGKRRLARVQDGRGNTIRIDKEPSSPYPPRFATRGERDCGPGAQVKIPGGSLVDEDGNPPPPGTLVDVAVGTVDLLQPDSMPGDYGAQDTLGRPLTMESYGAGSVSVTGSGKSYNLAAGASATLRIPVADIQLAAAAPPPPSTPRLFYNETTGVWQEDGLMVLDPAGQFYETQLPHFSTINTDILKEGQSCIRFQSVDMPLPYRVEIVVPVGGGAAPVVRYEDISENGKFFAIINLPNDTEVTLTAYDPDLEVPHGVFRMNSNGAQTGTPTAPNYTQCQTKVKIYPVEAPVPGADAFLHGLYSFAATRVAEADGSVPDPLLKQELEDATIDYYGTVDPRGLRKTFAEFKQTNGFVADGDTALLNAYGPEHEVRAAYANAIDLGFGRDMHGKRTLADDGFYDIAFYVSNYGSYDTDDEGDFEQAVGQDPADLIATVAMEWSRIEDPPPIPHNPYDPTAGPDPNDPPPPVAITDNERVIKFFVYNAAGDPVFAADLDGRGARPIPQLCMVCHGGAYDSGFTLGTPAFDDPVDVKLGAVMLPFDVHGYVLQGAVPAAFSKANQQLEFHELNKMVADTDPGVVIDEIVDEMYNPPTGDVQVEDFTVAGWSANAAQESFYVDVIRPACRVCHASRPLEDDGAGGLRDIRLQQASQFLSASANNGIALKVDQRVCSERVMPHALATYNRFWGSFDDSQPAIFPFQPARLKAFFDGEVEPALAALGEVVQLGNACATLAEPDDEVLDDPPTLTLVQNEILQGTCGGCHQNPPNFTDVTIELNSKANTFSTAVDVDAQELTTGKRVAIGGGQAAIDASYLVNKVSDDLAGLPCSGVPVANCGDPMPPPNGGLTPDQIDDIKEWIEDGAQNN